MILALLDTNIYNRILTQGQPGCEPEHFEQLKKLAAESKVTVIVPEVVLLEFQGSTAKSPRITPLAFRNWKPLSKLHLRRRRYGTSLTMPRTPFSPSWRKRERKSPVHLRIVLP